MFGLFSPPWSQVFEQALAFILIAAIAAIFAPRDRRPLLGAILLYAAGLAARGAAATAAAHAFAATASTIEILALVLQGIAFINLGAICFFSVLLRRLRLEPPRILHDLTVAFAYIVLVLYLFSIRQVDITGIIATSAVITAIIGFSLQDVLGNVMGGLALQLDRSFVPGDWVRVGEVAGRVRDVSWRGTTIESRTGDLFVIPNSLMIKNQVMVQGRAGTIEPKQRREVTFNVDYRYMPTLVIDGVTDALRHEPIPGVATDPPPHVIFVDYGDSWARYAARYWLTDFRGDEQTDSIIRTRVFYALRRSGVPLATPISNVYLQRGAHEQALFARGNVEDRLAALKAVPIFASLTHDELLHLASVLEYTPYPPGEAILVQGETRDELYILTHGSVEVRLSVDGATSTVARIDAPHFFGEGGMLTGEPRSASVVALTDVECWRLQKSGFQEIVQARPQIAGEISHRLAVRNIELHAVEEGLSEEAKRQRLRHEHESILERIQRFFAIG
ncbi:MAG TPA: mechanosensitive ion channel family protein [Thermoanaerobaculia bacterium]|nr:mechanosensitive ion channel family protein [Thermoanaerobaculia bacterium]